MRIGFDAKRLFHNSTGLGRYSSFMLEALLTYYPDNSYWLYSPKYTKKPAISKILSHTNVKVKTPTPWTSTLCMASYWRSVNLGKIAFRDGVDIFHGLSNELPILKAKGLKTVVTIHDVIFKRYPKLYNPIDTKIYSLKVLKACQNADRIIAISQQTANDLNTYFNVDKNKLRVVYQGCDKRFKEKATAEELDVLRLKYKLPNNFLLTVGTIEKRKNALLIVKALASIPSTISLIVVGRPTTYIHEIHQYIRKNQLQHRVLFLPSIDFEDLPTLYQMAKVFIYPSFFEGFGIPILEAITSGTPVITTTGSCFMEAGGPYSVYVDPTDKDQLAEAIMDIILDESKQKRMTMHSQQYIDRFEPDKIAQKLMNVYEELF